MIFAGSNTVLIGTTVVNACDVMDLDRGIIQRWSRLQERVEAACHAAGRDPSQVTILPVSKTFPPQAILTLCHLGQTRFGENKVQEIYQKQSCLADQAIQWVMIGHVQTNKVGILAQLAHEVHSLDRLKLAARLQRRLEQHDRDLDVLIQIKTSHEPSKYGLDPQELLAFLEHMQQYPRLHVRGLMTIALHTHDPYQIRQCFHHLQQLHHQACEQGYELPRLSMGMSTDLELAIAEGSTEIRVGTAIFGQRSYPDSYYWPE